LTTYFPLTPSNFITPTFQPTLDGTVYTCNVNWNLYGNRYYLICYDTDNNVVFNVAIVTSPPAQTLASLVWSAATLSVTATTSTPHGFKIGTIVQLTIVNANPAGYNGAYNVAITGSATFTYPLSAYPGQVVSPGSASWQISLCRGYFNSTIVYRNSQFEVSP